MEKEKDRHSKLTVFEQSFNKRMNSLLIGVTNKYNNKLIKAPKLCSISFVDWFFPLSVSLLLNIKVNGFRGLLIRQTSFESKVS